MRRIKCYDCGKLYDFDRDDFCPYCGAFTQPPNEYRVTADGMVERVDGLNEANHAGSFVHEELHKEDAARRRMGLERKAPRAPRSGAKPAARPAPPKPTQKSPSAGPKRKKLPFAVKVLLAIVIFNILANLLRAVL